MTAISITAANVRPDSTGTLVDGLSSEAVTIGKAVVQLTTGLWALADSNLGAHLTLTRFGVAMSSTSGANQNLKIQTAGRPTLSGMTIGAPLFVGSTPGDLVPFGDLASGMLSVCVGVPTSSTVLNMGAGPIVGGVVP